MNKPKTLQDALALVPEYILLRPRIDITASGDEAYNHITEAWEAKAVKVGEMVQKYDAPLRRPIPADVREVMAENIDKWRYNSNFGEINPIEWWLVYGGTK